MLATSTIPPPARTIRATWRGQKLAPRLIFKAAHWHTIRLFLSLSQAVRPIASDRGRPALSCNYRLRRRREFLRSHADSLFYRAQSVLLHTSLAVRAPISRAPKHFAPLDKVVVGESGAANAGAALTCQRTTPTHIVFNTPFSDDYTVQIFLSRVHRTKLVGGEIDRPPAQSLARSTYDIDHVVVVVLNRSLLVCSVSSGIAREHCQTLTTSVCATPTRSSLRQQLLLRLHTNRQRGSAGGQSRGRLHTRRACTQASVVVVIVV